MITYYTIMILFQLIEGSIIFVFDGSALTKINNETGVVESAGVDDLDTLSAAFLQAVRTFFWGSFHSHLK